MAKTEVNLRQQVQRVLSENPSADSATIKAVLAEQGIVASEAWIRRYMPAAKGKRRAARPKKKARAKKKA